MAGGAAAAHANYVRSNPAADARLQRAPTEVRIVFSEPPDPKGSEIEVLDVSGKRVDRGDTAASDEPSGLRVSMTAVADGGYAVAWTATSAVDGHVTKGSFAFAVGNAELPKVLDVGDASPPPRPLEDAGRILSYAGMAVLVGGALFGLAVRRAPTLAEDRREQVLLAAGAACVLIGSIALLLDQGGRAPPRLAGLLTVRGLAGVVVLAAAAALAEGRVRAVALGAGVVAALTATAVSHAAASDQLPQMALDLLHAVAASAWSGAVAALVAVLLPSAQRLGARELGGLVGRFSALAVVSVAVLSLTGVVQAFERLAVVEDLWETPYGIAISLKIVLLLVAVSLAAVNLLRWGPRLRRGIAADAARRWLARGVRGELVAIALVFVATGVLTALVPPAQASGAAYDETRHAGDLRLELLLATASPGQNRFVLRVHQGIAPVTDALKVAFRFTMVEHDMGENELVAVQRAPGEYVAAGNVTSMFGTWRIQAIVRRPERTDVSTTFTAPIGAPTGPGAVSRVIAAPPYTLVAFVDPPQPVSGAPLTLNVVVIDAKGDPVRGKPIRVTFSGPGSATVTATESSAGHFEAPVPALDAGKWSATIDVGGEATGDYAFDVAR